MNQETESNMPRVTWCPFETSSATQAYQERCEDRVAVFATDSRTVIVVADGAGGTGAGETAAGIVIREVESEYRNIHQRVSSCDC